VTLSYGTKSKDGRLHVVNDALAAPFNNKGIQVVTLMDPNTGLPITDFGGDTSLLATEATLQDVVDGQLPDGHAVTVDGGAVAQDALATSVDPVIIGGNVRADLTDGGKAKRLNTSGDGDLIIHQHTGAVTPGDNVTNAGLKTAITEDDASIMVYGVLPYVFDNGTAWDRLRGTSAGGVWANFKQIGDVAVNVNGGAIDTGTQTVTLATDDPAVAALESLGEVIEYALDTTVSLSGGAYDSGLVTNADDHVLDSIRLDFTTTTSKTITVKAANETIIYQDTNTAQHVVLSDINLAIDGGDGFELEITQTTGTSVDILAAIRKGQGGAAGGSGVVAENFRAESGSVNGSTATIDMNADLGRNATEFTLWADTMGGSLLVAMRTLSAGAYGDQHRVYAGESFSISDVSTDSIQITEDEGSEQSYRVVYI
jgi:hypothetical protein